MEKEPSREQQEEGELGQEAEEMAKGFHPCDHSDGLCDCLMDALKVYLEWDQLPEQE